MTAHTTADLPDLARLAAAGDRAALAELIGGVWRLVYLIAGRLGRRFRIDPDDLAQSAFARLVIALPRWRPEAGASVATFAAACARNAMLRAVLVEVRYRRPLRRPLAIDRIPARRPDALRGPIELAALSAVASLPSAERRTVETVHGLNGRRLDYTRFAYGPVYQRALDVLRVRLDPAGVN